MNLEDNNNLEKLLSKPDTRFELSKNFRSNLIKRLDREEQSVFGGVWMVVGVALLLLCALIALAVSGFFSQFSVGKDVVIYAIIFGALYVFFNFIEKKLLNRSDKSV